jgi:hypothetical protein
MGKHSFGRVSAATTALLFFLSRCSALAQPEFSFSGYVLTFPSYQRLNASPAGMLVTRPDQYADVSRIRLRPVVELWNDARFSLEYEIAGTYRSSVGLFSQTAEHNQRQVVRLTWDLCNSEKFQLTHCVDRLYFKQDFRWGEAVLGRQRISWGTGRIWNPTDLFNPINPASYAKVEKDGVDAAMIKFRLGDFTDLSLVTNPQQDWQTSNSGFRFRTNFSEFDVSVMGGYFDRRVVVGGDFAGNLLDAGVRGETIFSVDQNHPRSNFTKVVLGADYQFTSQLYGLLEYQFNGAGTMEKSSYDLNGLLHGAIVSLGRDYCAAQCSYLAHPLVTVSGSWISNLDDGSSFLGAVVTYSAAEELAVAVGCQVFQGNTFSEFWYYPLNIYAKVDLYF